MYRFIIRQVNRWSIGKSLILSLLVVAGVLFTSLVATTQKVDAQIAFNQSTPPQPTFTYSTGVAVAPSRILNLLASAPYGRWFEFQPGSRPGSSICLIYHFTPLGGTGRLQTSRETYAFNDVLSFGGKQCRFTSLGATAIARGVASLVNNNAIQITYPASPNQTERITIVGSLRQANDSIGSNRTQQIAVWRSDRDRLGRPFFRVWHRSFR